MKRKAEIKRKIFITWIISMICLSSFYTVNAAGTTVLSLLPETIDVTIGDSFYIYLNATIDTDEGIGGWECSILRFTPGILNSTDAYEGTAFDSYSSGFDDGTIDNASGTHIDVYAFIIGSQNVSGSVNLGRYLMYAYGVGESEVNFTSVISYGENEFTHSRNFTNVTVHPVNISGASSTTYGSDQINLTWTTPFGLGVDKCVIYASTTDIPTDRDPGDEIYNGTSNHYEHTGLSPSTNYNYTIWGYNSTSGIFSIAYEFDNSTTEEGAGDAILTISSPNPVNGTEIEYTTSQTVSVTVTKTGGTHSNFNYWINDSTGNLESGTSSSGSSINADMSVSSGTYWWTVYVYSEGNYSTANYSYTVNSPTSGGGGGGDWDPSPENGAPSIVINTALSVNVTDADLDDVNVTFYWGNGTRIDNDTVVGGNGIASVTPSTLSYNTEYFWYVIADDGLDTTRGPTSGNWSFNTSSLGIDITKEWYLYTANNTLKSWINVTNTGSTNLTNVVVYDVSCNELDFVSCSPGYSAMNGHIEWELGTLNISQTETIVVWFSLYQPLMTNGTNIWNYANVSHLGMTDIDYATNYTSEISYTIESNRTMLNDTMLSIKWWINVTNTGDFTLNNITIVQLYSSCMNFTGSNLVPRDENITFDMDPITPGSTRTYYVNMSATPSCLENGTRVFCNATIHTNETASTSVSDYVSFGGRTEQIRITYVSYLTDVSEHGDMLINILGVLLIIGSILLIVGLLYKFGVFGGGEQ